MTPIPENVVVIKLFALKFCAEFTDLELHSSHGDPFRKHFFVYVSGPLSGNSRPNGLNPNSNRLGLLAGSKSTPRTPEVLHRKARALCLFEVETLNP